MSDIVERLKAGVRQIDLADDNNTELFDIEEANEAMFEAAAEIERLRAQLAEARDKALDEAAEVAVNGRNYWRDKCDATKVRRESRDYETMAIACVHVEHAIRALKSPKPPIL